jgi:hypothetical protein
MITDDARPSNAVCSLWVRLAVLAARSHHLEAVLRLAALATAMRLAVGLTKDVRTPSHCLGTALIPAAFASTMRPAVLGFARGSRFGAALHLRSLCHPTFQKARLTERCSDGVEDQAAEEVSWAQEKTITSVLEAVCHASGGSVLSDTSELRVGTSDGGEE